MLDNGRIQRLLVEHSRILTFSLLPGSHFKVKEGQVGPLLGGVGTREGHLQDPVPFSLE